MAMRAARNLFWGLTNYGLKSSSRQHTGFDKSKVSGPHMGFRVLHVLVYKNQYWDAKVHALELTISNCNHNGSAYIVMHDSSHVPRVARSSTFSSYDLGQSLDIV